MFNPVSSVVSKKKKAIVLVSGGLDSATVCSIAQTDYDLYAISFDYGQRHASEIHAAKRVAEFHQVKQHRIINIDLSQLGGSALTDKSLEVPTQPTEGIPITYVPARNTVFLSYALAYAEVVGANDIFIGVNAVDYSGYPDCRPEYIQSFEKMANLALKSAVEGEKLTIHAPLINLTKAEIIKTGTENGLDYGITVSCYAADDNGLACGECDSCRLRKQGFSDAGKADPTKYR